MTAKELRKICIHPSDSIQRAMTCIDENERGIALVIDDSWRLLGTVTDGDTRRAMLAGLSMDAPVSVILEQKTGSAYPMPVTASCGTDRNTLIRIMQERKVRQIPILDEDGRLVDLETDVIFPSGRLPLQAVVMAGGMGTRLRPLTEELPKPMLPVGDRPLMEMIVGQLRHAGIRHVNVSTHYKPEKIIDYFGDGSAFGVELHYVREDKPLGTGGALGLIPVPDEPLLVINGDILTQVDFRAMLDYHKEYEAAMTVGVTRYGYEVPYGVIECSGPTVERLREKPNYSFLVNAGIYLLEPSVLGYIPEGQHCNITDLIQHLLDVGQKVVSFPIREYWLDIGQHKDYLQAQEDLVNGKIANW